MRARFDVYVVPRSSRPGPDGRRGVLPRLRVAAPPQGGRANREVEKTLSDLLGCRVRLVGGAKGRTKHCEADASRIVLQARLRSAFGPGG